MKITNGNAQKFPFSPRDNWTKGRTAPILAIVIHTCEGPEVARGALNVAAWFRHPTCRASAHLAVDDALIVRCVADGDTAWHANGANAWSIGIELQGRASQSPSDWEDGYSARVLENAAILCAALVRRHGIPVRRPRPAEVARLAAECVPVGIIGHADVTAAGLGGDHHDPGPAFPWAHFLSRVELLASTLPDEVAEAMRDLEAGA